MPIIENHVNEAIEAMDEAMERALEMIGQKCEGYAKRLCPVDTGLLRNSITHAVAGQGVSVSNYHATYGSNRTKKGNRVRATSKNAGSVGVGRYSSGSVGSADEKVVYIGTNVEYAPYVELGTQKSDAQPFLKPAAEDHVAEYRKILEGELRG